MRLKDVEYKLEDPIVSTAAARRSNVMLVGPGCLDEVRGRVASALNTSISRVSIASHRIGFSRWVLRCTGKADGTRFFAKTLLADPYPVPPRFATPWEELSSPEKPQRPAEEQIAAEWRMACEMRSLVGGESIPTPLGYSLDDLTLVFEEVHGTRLDRFARWAWPRGRRARSTETAIFRAAAWLRAVHESSRQGCETVEFPDVVDALRGLICKKALRGTLYAQWALKAVESLGKTLSPRTTLHIPVALNHGDFSLPNLIWDADREHLWVVDFELSARKPILHDLCTMIFELRKPLLYPQASRSALQACERAFWAGYGAVAEDLFVCVNALATARLFYLSFPKILTLPERRGWRGWLKATLYRALFQPYTTTRVFEAAGF